MDKKRSRKRKLAAAALGALIAAGLLCRSRPWEVLAVFQKDEAVHIKSGDAEDSTLAIGTHLIHLNAMSEELYEIAKSSASESGQLSVYYKSELADGAWFDITEASMVSDISSEGTPVEDSVIEELYFTCETRSDGLTYDLKTGETICIFDVNDPYDFENFSELESLKQQYELLRDKTKKSSAEKANEETLLDFFMKSLIDADTVLEDEKLEAMQAYYEKIAGEDDGKKDAVLSVMASQDASRRALALKTLERYLDELTDELAGMSGEQAETAEEAETETEDEQESSDGGLVSAAAESLKNVQDSIRTYEASALKEENQTASANVYYDLAQELMEAAKAQDDAACDAAAEALAAYENISQGVCADEEAEEELLTKRLIPEAEKLYQTLAASGTGEAYDAAKSESGASDAVLTDALKNQKSQADAAAEELKAYVKAKAQRLGTDEAASFLEEQLQKCAEWKAGVKDDAFADYALDSLGTYESWLEELKSSYTQSENGEALAELLAQKEEQQKRRQEALDGNDLEGAKKAEAELTVINEKIDALETAMSAAGEDAGEGESALAAAQKLADEAAESIQNGDLSGVEESIDGLGALSGSNAQAASDGLKEVYEALSAKKYLEDDGSDEIETLMDRVQTTLAEQTAPALLEESGGASNEAVLKLAKRQAELMKSEDSPYIYRKYEGLLQEYVSLKAVAECLDYRYVYDNDKRKVTLSQKGQTYTFYADEMKYKNGTKEPALSQNARFQDDIYISEADALEIFSCAAQYVPDTGDALLVVDGSEDKDAVYLYTLLKRLGV